MLLKRSKLAECEHQEKILKFIGGALNVLETLSDFNDMMNDVITVGRFVAKMAILMLSFSPFKIVAFGLDIFESSQYGDRLEYAIRGVFSDFEFK